MEKSRYPYTPPPGGPPHRADPTPVVERRAPTRDSHAFPCSGCGAGLEFAPGQTALQCPYCGNKQEIPTTAEQVRELSYLQYFRNARLAPSVVANAVLAVKCPKCAAVSQIPASVAADRCSFCGTAVLNQIAETTAMMAPQGVLPFLVADREAKARFAGWVAERWFAPSDLKKMAMLGRIDGMYVPFWTYDTLTVTHYTGQRGDHYWETVRDSKGNTRQERRTRWSSASGSVRHWFDDVLVCASRGLPDKLVHGLEPWELHNVKDYQPELVTGFRVERYQIDAEQGFAHAQEAMQPTIDMLIRRDIGGDEQRISTKRTHYDAITFKQILLPIWISAYDYGGKTYRVVVNAQTGARPWSWIKITLAVMLGILVVLAIVFGLKAAGVLDK